MQIHVRQPIEEATMVHFTGINHLHLKVSDIERAARFYEQGLGMQRVAAKYEGKLLVLIAPDSFDALTLSEGAIGAEVDHSAADIGSQGGVDHFGFSLSAGSDLEEAIERLTTAGGSYLRHMDIGPGIASAFLRDPDGYVFQIWKLPANAGEMMAQAVKSLQPLAQISGGENARPLYRYAASSFSPRAFA
jgi:catechol 2,3-dioxygenase-like lactoylglutathione lyase family enzyme